MFGYPYAVFTRRVNGMALGRRRYLGHVYHLHRVDKVNWAILLARRQWSKTLTPADRVEVVLDPERRYGQSPSPGGVGLL